MRQVTSTPYSSWHEWQARDSQSQGYFSMEVVRPSQTLVGAAGKHTRLKDPLPALYMVTGQLATQAPSKRPASFLHTRQTPVTRLHSWQSAEHRHGSPVFWLTRARQISGVAVDDVGELEVGDTVLGDTDVGDAVVGELDVGDSVLGDTDVGDTELGELEVGDTELGDADVGDTELGDADVGDTELGDADVGDTLLGEADVGDTLLGDADVGDTLLGDTDVGDAVLGDADVGEMEVGLEVRAGRVAGPTRWNLAASTTTFLSASAPALPMVRRRVGTSPVTKTKSPRYLKPSTASFADWSNRIWTSPRASCTVTGTRDERVVVAA